MCVRERERENVCARGAMCTTHHDSKHSSLKKELHRGQHTSGISRRLTKYCVGSACATPLLLFATFPLLLLLLLAPAPLAPRAAVTRRLRFRDVPASRPRHSSMCTWSGSSDCAHKTKKREHSTNSNIMVLVFTVRRCCRTREREREIEVER